MDRPIMEGVVTAALEQFADLELGDAYSRVEIALPIDAEAVDYLCSLGGERSVSVYLPPEGEPYAIEGAKLGRGSVMVGAQAPSRPATPEEIAEVAERAHVWGTRSASIRQRRAA